MERGGSASGVDLFACLEEEGCFLSCAPTVGLLRKAKKSEHAGNMNLLK